MNIDSIVSDLNQIIEEDFVSLYYNNTHMVGIVEQFNVNDEKQYGIADSNGEVSEVFLDDQFDFVLFYLINNVKFIGSASSYDSKKYNLSMIVFCDRQGDVRSDVFAEGLEKILPKTMGTSIINITKESFNAEDVIVELINGSSEFLNKKYLFKIELDITDEIDRCNN